MDRERINAALKAVQREAKKGRTGIVTSTIKGAPFRADTSVTADEGRIRREGKELYWTSTAGAEYHVYDISLVSGKKKRVPYESKDATHRIFVSRDTSQRIYEFVARERRICTASTCDRQLVAGRFEQAPWGRRQRRPLGPGEK